jgi:hypothetical protein
LETNSRKKKLKKNLNLSPDDRPPISWGMVLWKVRHCCIVLDNIIGPQQNSKIVENRDLAIKKIWPKALPHYVLIFMCRHREMYYYFVHLRSSCYIMPLFLLLISPSALTLSDLYFRNTSLGQKQYSNTSPHRFVVVGFLVPLPQFIFVF